MQPILRGLAAAVVYVAAYVFLVGALTYLNAVVFGLVERRFASAPWQGWLQYHWPFFTVAYAPAALAALLSAWWSRLSIGGAAALLGAYFAPILLVMELDYGSWEIGKPTQMLQALLLAGVFFVVAGVFRRRTRWGR